jgi:hypothetical protein
MGNSNQLKREAKRNSASASHARHIARATRLLSLPALVVFPDDFLGQAELDLRILPLASVSGPLEVTLPL